MSDYAWVITKDCFDEGTEFDAKGTAGPHDIVMANSEIREHPDAHDFRMLDDEGNIMCYGKFVGDASSEDAFGPLDDFGTPNWGCTEIQYKENGEWKCL